MKKKGKIKSLQIGTSKGEAINLTGYRCKCVMYDIFGNVIDEIILEDKEYFQKLDNKYKIILDDIIRRKGD